MPELPEVETVRRGLQPAMEGARVDRLEQRRPDLRFPFPDNFSARITGRRITNLQRRAKYLLIGFDDGTVLISHLGMSGSYYVDHGATKAVPGRFHHDRSKDERHDHVVFHLAGPAGAKRVVYNDPRRFGFMLLTDADGVDATR